MIRSHFGLQRNPFDTENLTLLEHQQQVLDILRVHAQQGGLCLVLGEPGPVDERGDDDDAAAHAEEAGRDAPQAPDQHEHQP